MSIDRSSYKYKTALTRRKESSRRGSAFSRGHLLHWGLDGREGPVVLFLAKSRTRFLATASVRSEASLQPSWGDRIKV